MNEHNHKDKDRLRKQIDRYIAEELDHQEIEQLWEDLLDYPELLEELKAQAAIKSIYKESGGPRKDQPRNLFSNSKSTIKWTIALAAILLIAVGIGIFGTQTQEAAPEPLATISLEYMESPDVQRSENAESLSGKDSLLHAGYSAAVNQDIQLAVSYFEDISELNLDDQPSGKSKLNLAIIFYNDQDFEHASTLFTEAIEYAEDRSVLEKSKWFLANTYIQLGDYDNALKWAAEVYEADGMFKEEAYQTMSSLNQAGLNY